jgi:regulatory protein
VAARPTGTAVDVRRAAMDLLARREHSRLELRTKLGKRFDVDAHDIVVQVDRLEAEGLQSDRRLAEAYIRARSNRGHGPIKIRVELRVKGVDDDLSAAAFNECGIDWSALATEVEVRRFGEDPSIDLKEKARRGRFLLQRGFSFDHINQRYREN